MIIPNPLQLKRSTVALIKTERLRRWTANPFPPTWETSRIARDRSIVMHQLLEQAGRQRVSGNCVGNREYRKKIVSW
ncbi:hypothetical protein VTN00DRAFT_6476 [Thermoascus crustaceus]|uniref:uncharacterized protein n=1 Tax=Thermoascus crustaceus TaxID=5088 RepID=UPI003744722A